MPLACFFSSPHVSVAVRASYNSTVSACGCLAMTSGDALGKHASGQCDEKLRQSDRDGGFR
jgi:hypothetical protein